MDTRRLQEIAADMAATEDNRKPRRPTLVQRFRHRSGQVFSPYDRNRLQAAAGDYLVTMTGTLLRLTADATTQGGIQATAIAPPRPGLRAVILVGTRDRREIWWASPNEK